MQQSLSTSGTHADQVCESHGLELQRSRSMSPDSIDSQQREDGENCSSSTSRLTHPLDSDFDFSELSSNDIIGVDTGRDCKVCIVGSNSNASLPAMPIGPFRQIGNDSNPDTALPACWSKDGFGISSGLPVDNNLLELSPSGTLTGSVLSTLGDDCNLLLDDGASFGLENNLLALKSGYTEDVCSSSHGENHASQSDDTELFCCPLLTVNYSKIFAADCLQIILCFIRGNEADCSAFIQASVVVVTSDNFFNLKVISALNTTLL